MLAGSFRLHFGTACAHDAVCIQIITEELTVSQVTSGMLGVDLCLTDICAT